MILRILLSLCFLVLVSAGSRAEIKRGTEASIARGGRLYDNWHKEMNAKPPDTDHPAYPTNGAYKGKPATNWRCKECHGWDYLGDQGQYAKGNHRTAIGGINGPVSRKPDRVIAVLSGANHRFDEVLDEQSMADLALFLSSGQVDMSKYISNSGSGKGKVRDGRAYYQTLCVGCHGLDGDKIEEMPALGKLARENPWECAHKILNGQPATAMPALRALDRSVLADIITYLQTLPAK